MKERKKDRKKERRKNETTGRTEKDRTIFFIERKTRSTTLENERDQPHAKKMYLIFGLFFNFPIDFPSKLLSCLAGDKNTEHRSGPVHPATQQ